MEQEVVQALFEKGAFLIFLNAPQGLEFGIDYNSWEIGPKFMGVKIIPPADTSRTSGLRTGFFKFYESKEVVIKEWDPLQEDLKDSSQIDQELNERLKADMRRLDQYLGLYPLSPPTSYQKWVKLTNYITSELISKVLPMEGKISNISCSTLDEEELSQSDSHHCQFRDEKIMFTNFDLKRSWRPEAVGPEITKYSQDKNYKELLGELQLAFVCLLLAQNYAGLLQWKNLSQILFRSRDALESYAETLFLEFLDVLRHQLEVCPDDFFLDVVTENNFLAKMLTIFRHNISEVADLSSTSSLKRLQSKFDKFQEFLKQKFKWDIVDLTSESEAEEGEYAPILVELSEP
ncbi:hypothetical protein G9A89_005955 [Geosiphon pyriformis]|nr:hypothetical protein G9A89_005955 [Geosiphon pyriformis]